MRAWPAPVRTPVQTPSWLTSLLSQRFPVVRRANSASATPLPSIATAGRGAKTGARSFSPALEVERRRKRIAYRGADKSEGKLPGSGRRHGLCNLRSRLNYCTLDAARQDRRDRRPAAYAGPGALSCLAAHTSIFRHAPSLLLAAPFFDLGPG